MTHPIDPATAALLLVDLQNDFLHPAGAYGRGGQTSEAIAALPARLLPLAQVLRKRGGWVVSTQFTLVPGKGGEPFISNHLKILRPFLEKGDFLPGGWGHQLVDALQPADITIEKVAYSAFYMSRMEFALRRAGIETLITGGIVTNGGVASTVRDAHVRDLNTIVLSDGCAAFRAEVHEAAIADLSTVSTVMTCAEALAWIEEADPVVTVAETPPRFDVTTDVVVIGAGASGLTAGLRALEAGAEAIVLERDARPSGSTAMSSGFIPAPGTRFQRAVGVTEAPADFARDIQKKAAGGADPEIVRTVTEKIGPALEWLADRHGLEWQVLDDFLYPGHSAHRMHAVPEKTGAALITRLLTAAEAAGLPVVTNAHVTTLHTGADATITGVSLTRPDGAVETIGCKAVILACNGYGGNPDLVARHIPEIASAPYFGHPGNTGDAVLWGRALGAAEKDLTAYQGHGSLAHPHGILITWALMMEGGIQVNAEGRRFSNEHAGYSEQAVKVLAQPGGVAWNVYDDRLHRIGMGFPDYREAIAAGAGHADDNAASLAGQTGLPADALAQTLAQAAKFSTGAAADPFGRDFTAKPALSGRLHAIRVTGALFHTQGGLVVDAHARVLKPDGAPLPNLFAGGGAACGVSGARVEGYLSGNGLLTAVGLGYIAGRSAAACAAD